MTRESAGFADSLENLTDDKSGDTMKGYGNWKRLTAVAFTAIAVSSMCGCREKTSDGPIILKDVKQAKNIILMIGDGMGPQQIKAGELFKGERLTMQNFPYMTKVDTCSRSDTITDSAAAATAMATGVRTTNGIVGKDPAYTDLETIVDIAHAMGKRTGIIATEELYGATPMGFSGHADTRGEREVLLHSAATTGNVDLFASSIITIEYQNIFTSAGYEMMVEADEISDSTADKVFGSYVIPAVAESMSAEGNVVAFDRLVTEALDYLSKDKDGFFLMAEGSHIDHGGHNNDICYMLEELLAFDDGVQAALEWAKDRDDTVVIVLADHETGGLEVDALATHEEVVETYENGGAGAWYFWLTTGHSSTDINCYINGANIDFAKYSYGKKSRIKNTDVFDIMKSLLQGD